MLFSSSSFVTYCGGWSFLWVLFVVFWSFLPLCSVHNCIVSCFLFLCLFSRVMLFGSIEFWCLKTFFLKRIFRCFFICCRVDSFLYIRRKILVNSVIYIEPFWCFDCERVYYFDFFFFVAFFWVVSFDQTPFLLFPSGERGSWRNLWCWLLTR